MMNNKMMILLRTLLVLILALSGTSVTIGQTNEDEPEYMYFRNPGTDEEADTIAETDDRMPGEVVEEIYPDQDSLELRLRFIEDSIQARLQFLQDSILAREAFIRDSIARRQRILDSLSIFVSQLPRLLDASMKAHSDEIIFKTTPIRIVGDSTLSNYENYILTFDFTSPFTPWKTVINLSNKPPGFEFEPGSNRIRSIKAPKLECSFEYGRNDRILIVRTRSSIVSKRSGQLYKEPVDSVFFDKQDRVVKVKKYHQYFEVRANYQKGQKLFLHLDQVKQYQYNPAGEMVLYELTRFCDRTRVQDPVKVCNRITYEIDPRGNTYYITRKNMPENEFSDGVFTYEFKEGNILSGVSFENNKKTEQWKTIIEVNAEGNVSRYLYDKDGFINQTLLVNYYLDDPRARHKVETITCTFENDGISYYQKNNTTGKSRVRDRMTMEWSDWR